MCRAEDNKTNLHHVGVYLGDGQVVEAKGTKDGVVASPLSRWHRSAELKFVDYGQTEGGGKATNIQPKDVFALQRALASLGFAPGRIDGVLGPRTKAALEAFMEANGLSTEAEALSALEAACVPIPLSLAQALLEALKKGGCA
ncbi:MAG: peptidoglycan-binding protein [Clostridia bacterium]|nr:peptidoglycan-binding protein [Clostridia bacterium]